MNKNFDRAGKSVRLFFCYKELTKKKNNYYNACEFKIFLEGVVMKKFLIVSLLMSVLTTLPASAEQPAAEQYRQMFASGNFYVEYRVADKNKQLKKSAQQVLSLLGKKDNKSKKPEHYIRAGLNGQRIAKTGVKDKYPSALYRDGNYYKFIVSTEESSNIIVGSHTKTLRNAYLLQEDRLYSPNLDPDEHWETVRKDLTLPEVFNVFFPNDPMNDDAQIAPKLLFNGESKRTIDNKEYDCDQYINDIKSLAGTVIAQEAYNMLYDGGKLVRIQKYLCRDGKEFLITDLIIESISAQVPDEAFAIHKKFKLYEARKGDMNDLLNNLEQIGEMGGSAQ